MFTIYHIKLTIISKWTNVDMWQIIPSHGVSNVLVLCKFLFEVIANPLSVVPNSRKTFVTFTHFTLWWYIQALYIGSFTLSRLPSSSLTVSISQIFFILENLVTDVLSLRIIGRNSDYTQCLSTFLAFKNWLPCSSCIEVCAFLCFHPSCTLAYYESHPCGN